MVKNHDSIRQLFPFLPARRKAPAGVKISAPLDLRNYLPFRVHRLGTRLGFVGEGMSSAAFNVAAEEYPAIKVREWRLMLLLASCGPLTNTEIAAIAAMNAATISRAVNQLADEGFLTSKPFPGDGRKTLLSLTPKGAEFFNRIASERYATVDQIESCLSDDEQETLYRLLDKIDQRLNDIEGQEEESEIPWEA